MNLSNKRNLQGPQIQSPSEPCQATTSSLCLQAQRDHHHTTLAPMVGIFNELSECQRDGYIFYFNFDYISL